jgi:hypothetical protein
MVPLGSLIRRSVAFSEKEGQVNIPVNYASLIFHSIPVLDTGVEAMVGI